MADPAARPSTRPRADRRRGVARRLLALLVVTGLAVVLAPAAGPAAAQTTMFGHDVSWPQCATSQGGFALPMPPDSSEFVIIGMTKGLAFTENPCLASQVDWARSRGKPAHAYAMATFPTAAQLSTYGSAGPWATGTRAGRLLNVGYAEAQAVLASLRRVEWSPPVVWIDVEPRPAQPWPSSTAQQRLENRHVIEGMMRAFADAGVGYGLYSYTSGWNEITGSWRLPGVPVWATAGYLDYPDEALDRCTQASFSGGQVYVSQWTDGTRDYNRTCGSYGFTDLPVNLARADRPTVTASSQNAAAGQTAAKAADSATTGFPTDGSTEWATTGGASGSWLELTWDRPVSLSRVVLYDRPNTDDRVTGGTLTFSDGSSVPVGALDNAGAATDVTFAARTVTSVRFTVTTVSAATLNIGLAELEAWGNVLLTNVARTANPAVTASSENTVSGQTAVKAVDGSPLGYPTDHTKEWATIGGTGGSWIQLTWAEPVTLNRVVLHDRPNSGDRITRGTLLFSDGSTVPTGALTDTGARTEVTFAPRTVTSLRLTADAVSASTLNIGLAEIETWGTSSLVNLARTAGTAVTSSSENTTTGQTAVKAVDGSPLGYPTDHTKEWATIGGTGGSWIQVTWPQPVTLRHIVLVDRPNTADQVTAGTLTFSDGSTVPVSTLANTGTPTQIPFPARTVTSVRFTITAVSPSTANTGLAEIETWGTSS